jgi:hypothetical protein
MFEVVFIFYLFFLWSSSKGCIFPTNFLLFMVTGRVDVDHFVVYALGLNENLTATFYK